MSLKDSKETLLRNIFSSPPFGIQIFSTFVFWIPFFCQMGKGVRRQIVMKHSLKHKII